MTVALAHHAYLVRNAHTLQDLENVLHDFFGDISANPDVFRFEEDMLSVETARVVKERQLTRAIGQEAKQLFLISFTTATTEAQNALLKVLEEPTQDTIFFIATSHPHALLPTLRSRLEELSTRVTHTALTIEPQTFAAASKQERLAIVAPLIEEKDVTGATTLIDGIEALIHDTVVTKDAQSIEAYRVLEETRRSLSDRGASLKLLLEYLALSLPQQIAS